MLRLLFFSLLLTLTTRALQANPEAMIISADDTGLLIELTLPPFELKTTQATCQRIEIPAWANTPDPGNPELPFTALLMQVPATGDIAIQYLEPPVYQTLPQVNLCPVAQRVHTPQGETVSEWVAPQAVYQQDAFFPTTLTTLEPRGILRGVSVSRLRLHPFQWHPLTQELRYFPKLRLKVQFDNPLPTTSPLRRHQVNATYDTMLSQLLVNYTPSPLRRRQATSGLTRAKTTETSTRTVMAEDSLHIEIKAAGIYQLTYEALDALGLRPDLMLPQQFHLFNQAQPVALKAVTAAATVFQPGDYLLFYAQPFNTIFTDTNQYQLHWRKKTPGKRMAQIDGQVKGEGTPLEAFYDTMHLEQDSMIWLNIRGAPEKDFYFWQRLNAGESWEYTLPMPSPALGYPEALLQITFQGLTTAPPNPNHHTVVQLNGTVIGDERWHGEIEYLQSMFVSPELFKASGENTLTIQMADVEANVDVVFVNALDLGYWRRFEAVDDQLVFDVEGEGKISVAIDKFSQPEIVLYDITDPYQVAEIVNFSTEESGQQYRMRFEDTVIGHKRYYALTEAQQQRLENTGKKTALFPHTSSHLKSTRNGADYLLITSEEFLPVVAPLIELRQNQGLRAKAIAIEEIYKAFNSGLADPAALKAFLQYAYEHWSAPAPSYVFLVGDSTEKYYRASKNKGNRIPFHFSDSADGLTADDSWFVSVDGDDILPDMMIGRMLSNDIEMATKLIDKIIRFELSEHKSPQRILLIADSGEEFQRLNDELIERFPPEFTEDKVYLSDYTKEAKTKAEKQAGAEKANQDIIGSINQGVMLTNYIGHGSTFRWSTNTLFDSSHVSLFTNETQLSFVLTLTCINGYFPVANGPTLAEYFILADAGTLGAFAPTNVSYSWEDTILSREIFSILFEQNNRSLGAITTQSKIAAYQRGTSSNVIKMFTLLGDPATNLKDWH